MIDPAAANRDAIIMLLATFALVAMSLSIRGTRRINRAEGAILVISFAAYQYFIFSQVA